MNKDKICPNCHRSGFDHTGWTCAGKPYFVCQGCRASWTDGLEGGVYYANAQSHPEKIIIIGWEPEDYKRYRLKAYGNWVIIKPR